MKHYAPHPDPWTPTVEAVIIVCRFSKVPYWASIKVRRSPGGSSPPPAEIGARFFQKILWLTWPPPLNLMACWSEIIDEISPLCWASSNFALAILKFATYAAWCLVWWICMISAEIWCVEYKPKMRIMSCMKHRSYRCLFPRRIILQLARALRSRKSDRVIQSLT